MGTSASTPNDEWIELYNNTTSTIDLTGWTLVSTTDGSPNIALDGTISSGGFYLLERSDDDTVSNILADRIYTGALSQTEGKPGEKLELRDANGNLIDMIDCSTGWFAGTTTEYVSMERRIPEDIGNKSDNWVNCGCWFKGQGEPIGLDANGNPIKGTPKFDNSYWGLGAG